MKEAVGPQPLTTRPTDGMGQTDELERDSGGAAAWACGLT